MSNLKTYIMTKSRLSALILAAALLVPSMSVKAQYVDEATGVTYTAVGGSVDGNEGSLKACDGDTGTKLGTGAYPNTVIVEASKPIFLDGYTIITANDNAAYTGRNPKDWTIEGSNDQKNWTLLVEVKGDNTLEDVNFTPFEFEAPISEESFTYFRFTVKASHGGGFMQYSEFHPKGQLSLPPITITPVAGSGGFGGEGYENLFDGETGTKFCTNQIPAWVICEATRPVFLNGYTMYTANDTQNSPDRNPKNWTIEGSNDAENWTLIEVVQNNSVMGATNFTPYEFTLSNPVAEKYKYYRFIFSATGGSLYQVSELVLNYGTKPAGVVTYEHSTFSWSAGKTVGGHLSYVNGEGNELTDMVLTLNGRAQNLNDLESSADAGHALITLDNVLKKGDILLFKTASGNGGLHLVFSNGFVYEQALSGGSTKIVVPDEAVGSAAVIVTRTDASTEPVAVWSISKGTVSYGVQSSPWVGNVVGDYIARLFNPATENFLAQGNAWGTQASRAEAGLRFQLTKQEDGLYKIVTCNYPDRQFGWDNGSGFYVDINQQANTFFEFAPAPVENSGNVVYTILAKSYVNGEEKLTGYLATNGAADNTVVFVQDNIDEYCFWQVIDDTKRMVLEDAIKAARAKANGEFALQVTDENAPGYIWTNAQEPSEGPIANLIDGSTSTFFHTAWSAASEDPHYLAVDLGEGESVKSFVINYTRRMNNNNNRPTEIIIYGSNDKENWTSFRTLTQEADGLPTEQGDDSYTSELITADAGYRYLKFEVTHTNNEARSGSSNSLFFTFSEFSISSPISDAQKEAILAAVEAMEAVVADPATAEDAFEAAAADLEQQVKDILAPTVDSPFLGEAVADGGYWAFYNPVTKNFLNQGNSWGTQASRAEAGLRFTLTANEEGLYKIVTNNYPNRQLGWDNGSGFYVDINQQANTLYKFETIKTQDDNQVVYTIKALSYVNDELKLEGYLSTNAENTVVFVQDDVNEYAYWQVLDETQKQALEDAIIVAQNAAYDKIALQVNDENAPGYIWTNAQEPTEGPIANLIDEDTNTMFHTAWSAASEDPHYLAVDFGEGKSISEFILRYTRRMNNNNNRPTEIILYGSDDKENWTAFRTLTEAEDGLPTAQGNDSYTSDIIAAGAAYRYVKFEVTRTNNEARSSSSNSLFFTFSEFSLVQKSAANDDIQAAVAEAEKVLNDPTSTKADLREARKNLLRATFPIVDGTYYLYNKENDKFLSRGAAWGTQACLGEFGLPFISKTVDGLTSLSALDWADCRIALTNGTDGGTYVDQYNEGDLVYEYTGGEYIFRNTANNGYLAIEDNENTKALFGLGVHGTDATALRFKLLSAAEYEKMVADRFAAGKAEAMAAAGLETTEGLFEIDATDKVQSASLTDSNEGWTWATNQAGIPGLYRGGGLTTNENGTETWQGCGVLSQVVEGLQPGLYKVALSGFFRIDTQRALNVEWYNNGYVMSTAFLAANGNEVRIKPVGAEATVLEDGGIYPNWMSESKACFDEGKYVNEVFAYVGEDGKLDIAVIQPTWKGDCWLMLGGVKLTYFSTEAAALNGEEGTTGINNVAAEVVSRTIYNANGSEVAEPAQGINIVKSVMSDGTIKVEKVLVK